MSRFLSCCCKYVYHHCCLEGCWAFRKQKKRVLLCCEVSIVPPLQLHHRGALLSSVLGCSWLRSRRPTSLQWRSCEPWRFSEMRFSAEVQAPMTPLFCLWFSLFRVLHIILAVLIIKRERDTETLEQKKRMNLWTSSNVVLSYLRGLAAATTLVATVATSNPEEAVAQPDLFIMAMSHQPEFCFQHKKAGYSGCQHPRDFWKKSLTIHGLWPEVRTELVLCLFSLIFV